MNRHSDSNIHLKHFCYGYDNVQMYAILHVYFYFEKSFEQHVWNYAKLLTQ